MHHPNGPNIEEDPDTEGFHNIISNILQVVLVDTLVLLSHAFNQLKPKLLLKVYAFINP